MEYRKLGSTGLDVSKICLGCMSFGDPQRGGHPWSLSEDAARPIIRQALEGGINFFDTANVYSDGSSEEIVGRALAEHSKREEIVLATKVHGRMFRGPNGSGLSRKAILSEIDNSLRRLGTDYVDLYQIHRFDQLDSGRRDPRGPSRCGEDGQGSLRGCLVDVRLAVRQDASHGGTPRLDPIRVHAGPLQPPLPRRGAGDAPALRRRGDWRHTLEPARPWSTHPGLERGHRTERRPTSSAGGSTRMTTGPSCRLVADLADERAQAGPGGVGLAARQNR